MASNSFPEEDFSNFDCKVDEIGEILRGLCSPDETSAKDALKKADAFLAGERSEIIDGIKLKTTQSKTVINQKAFDELDLSLDHEHMSKETFMAQAEEDAKKRAEDRRMRKEEAKGFQMRANQAFREKNYDKALHLYNQAVSCYKENLALFTNRALTCIHLELYQRAIADCDFVLRFDEYQLKALLYKGRALHRLGNRCQAEKCFDAAIQHHPKERQLIEDFRKQEHQT